MILSITEKNTFQNNPYLFFQMARDLLKTINLSHAKFEQKRHRKTVNFTNQQRYIFIYSL